MSSAISEACWSKRETKGQFKLKHRLKDSVPKRRQLKRRHKNDEGQNYELKNDECQK